MSIYGEVKTTVKTSAKIKNLLRAEAGLEGRDMCDLGAEAIALYVMINRDIRDELGFETNGELISAAVDEYIEKRDLDQ